MYTDLSPIIVEGQTTSEEIRLACTAGNHLLPPIPHICRLVMTSIHTSNIMQNMQQQQETSALNLQFPDAKIRTISSILNVCERTTMNMERDSIANTIKAIVIICLKFVNKEDLFKSIIPDFYIDWEYVRGQSTAGNSKKNILGDAATWLHLMQFVDFSECGIPDRVMQQQYPPLYCLHSGIMSAGTGGRLNFSDACKMLILNNIEGLTTKRMIELHTSSRLNCNTHLICAGIVSALADERHGADVYEKTFKYVLGSLMKVDEAGLAQHIAHYKQTAAARAKAWEIKAIQSRVTHDLCTDVKASAQHFTDSVSYILQISERHVIFTL